MSAANTLAYARRCRHVLALLGGAFTLSCSAQALPPVQVDAGAAGIGAAHDRFAPTPLQSTLAAAGSAATTASVWTPRLQAKLAQLQRAARGSGLVVERDRERLRIAAAGDEAFAPNRAEIALPLRAFLDEMADDDTLMASFSVAVIGRTTSGGRADANLRLANARATAVQRHLQLRGVRLAPAEPTSAEVREMRGVELFVQDDVP